MWSKSALIVSATFRDPQRTCIQVKCEWSAPRDRVAPLMALLQSNIRSAGRPTLFSSFKIRAHSNSFLHLEEASQKSFLTVYHEPHACGPTPSNRFVSFLPPTF
jgi:hypothetical protein